MLYFGIDPTAGRRPLNYAVLDDKLSIVVEGSGKPADVLGLVERYPEIMCAVDAPFKPNAGLMATPRWRSRFNLPLDKTTWTQYRVCEYELRRRGINLYPSPADSSQAPSWMRAGWVLYDQLRAAGFETYPSTAARQMFEVHPHASFTVRLGRVPFRKDTLEGRLQRQLLLYDEGVGVADAMAVFEEITRHHLLSGTLNLNGLRAHDELDALAAALTAYYAHARPSQVLLIGDPADGQIVVPASQLKDRY